jgi:transposase-like protein
MKLGTEDPVCPFCGSRNTEIKSNGKGGNEMAVYLCNECRRDFSGPRR